MNNNAFICGASSGIGLTLVKKFLKEGFNVYATSRRRIPFVSERLTYFPSDFYDDDSIKRVCDEVVLATNNSLNVVVNCVGDILEENTIQNFDISTLHKTFQINYFSSFILSKHLFSSVSSSHGCFLFLSSVAKDKVYPLISDYSSAKAALSNFTKSLAIELAPFKARAISISPAVVNTPLFDKGPYSVEQASSWHKLGRIGETDEIADFIYFLTSSKAGWITGTDYTIDGGMML